MRILTIFSYLFITFSLQAQQGYKIDVHIDGYTEDSLFLAYYMGDKQYILDTVIRDSSQTFVFSGEQNLPGGMYLIVMSSGNKFFQILIDSNDQHFSINTQKGSKQISSMRFKGSDENTQFYDYLRFLAAQRPIAQRLQRAIAEESNVNKKAKTQKMLKAINERVVNRQKQIIAHSPHSLNTAIIKLNMSVDFPHFDDLKEDVDIQKLRWWKKHYFDNIDLADSRLLRTSFLFKK